MTVTPDATACAHKVFIKADTPSKELFKQSKVKYIINGVVDLHGNTYQIPEGCILSFKKGSLVNGILIGDKTKLKSIKPNTIGVLLSGSWQCESFSDLTFNSDYLSDNQIMSSINALQSDDIKQEILLERPEYHCDIPKNDGALLLLSSNTTLKNASSISISGNNYTSYNIIRIKGKENVTVTGGELHGDVGKHSYSLTNSSQWGHGINIHSSSNVSITDIVITHCIGDGVAVSGSKATFIGDYSHASHDIVLSHVITRYNRRQGLSIIYASDVKVEDCVFSDTGVIEKHSPSAGIDIEPNTAAPYYQAVRNVTIRNCTLDRNVGFGILSNHYESHDGVKSVENVFFDGCGTDGRVVLYTGGISFLNTKMLQLSIIAEKDPIIGSTFTGCTIEGGNGVQFYCPNSGRDISTMVGDIVFDNCDITVPQEVDSGTSRGIIWSRGKTARLRNVTMRNCRISIPANASSGFNLLGSEDADVLFEDCRINIPGRRFPADKVRRYNCRIISHNINE